MPHSQALEADRSIILRKHDHRHTSSEMHPDEILARALLRTQADYDDVVSTISYSRGFPVWTHRQTVLFILRQDNGPWAVRGDFNDWNPFPMQQAENGLWYAELRIPRMIGQGIRYSYINAENEVIADPLARCFGEDNDGEFSYLKRPSRTQYLMRWNDFKSPQGLKSRPLHILVPPNPGPYDVLYVHDGQNLFSKDSICGGWKLCENMAEIGGNFLIVGIWNSPDRMREYTHATDLYDDDYHATLGRKYASFVEETVRPFIESHFETTPRAGLMGSSLGGLISLYIANCYPGRYDSVFALSPTTAWGHFGSDNGPLIRDFYEKSGHQNTFLYIDHGGMFPKEGMPDVFDRKAAIRDESGWASPYDNCCHTFDFVSALVELGYRQSVDMFYQHIPGAMHNEGAWASRVSRPLRLFMQKKK